MEIIETALPGLLIVQPKVFADDRGYFMETFRSDLFEKFGIDLNFVQDNESKSKANVLRGLHFQLPPFAQGKLVRVISGAVLDVAVDIRRSSPTFGKWVAVEITAENKKQMLIPSGFAHGFLTLADDTIFAYKCTNYYDKSSERSIRWNDPEIGIEWNAIDPVLSAKDMEAPLLADSAELF